MIFQTAILVLLLLMGTAGAQERNLLDQFGRTVSVSADGKTYSVSSPDGFSASVQPQVPGDDISALRTINAMAPAVPAAPVTSRP